ncbi:MAG: beta-eliminating lyase-related protein, partial [Pseudomonadota bacterium]
GARLMHAVVATGSEAKALTERMDTVSLCLSKGLGAPVGSVLSGPRDFVARARRNRKMLGGGLRQSGVLAACGLYALENNVERLAEDHANAAELGARLSAMNGIALAQPVETNMVWLTIDVPDDAPSLAAFMAERSIVMADPGADGGLRLVAHLDFDAGMIDAVVDAFSAWFAA